MSGGSGRVRRRIRDGSWRAVAPGALGWAALLAAAADVTSTWHVLTDPGSPELNAVITSLSEIHLALGVAWLALTSGTLVAITWLDLGWWSPVAGWFVVVTRGVSGGINNAVGVHTGFYVNDLAGGQFAVEMAFPAVGLAVGLASAHRHFERLPWQEVILTAFAIGAFAGTRSLLVGPPV